LERRRAPLHYAAEQGYQDVAVALLSAGAPATTYDRDRNTPLHFAAARGHNGCVELLLSGGADVLAEDAEGRVPLDLAEMRRHESTEAIIRNWMTKLMEELQREKHMSRTVEMDKEQGGEVELVGDHNLL
jgi:ankyrin repeat protein